MVFGLVPPSTHSTPLATKLGRMVKDGELLGGIPANKITLPFDNMVFCHHVIN